MRLHLGARARGLPEDLLDHWFARCLDLRPRLVNLTDDFVMPTWSPEIEVSPHPRGIVMLTLAEVERLVGLKKSSIYNRIGEGRFPRPVPLGRVLRRWARHEIDGWIADRIDALLALRRADSVWLPESSTAVA